MAVNSADSFENGTLNVEYKNGFVNVTGSFDSDICIGQKYNIFLETFNDSGMIERVQLSDSFVIKSGHNSFKHDFEMFSKEQHVRAFVLTEKLAPVCCDFENTVVAKYMEWAPCDVSFYNLLSNPQISEDTNFEKLFADNSEVTVAEAVAIASNLHAIYNDSEVNEDTAYKTDKLRYDFDSMDGISLYKATGKVQDGTLVTTPVTPTANGNYDHGFYLDDLDFYATSYDTFKIRMKRDALDNVDPTKSRPEFLQVYFCTTNDLNFTSSRGYSVNLKTLIGQENLSDWFEVEIDLSENGLWKDTISRMRIDPTDNNGVYYIDYVELSKKPESNTDNEWYDLYINYAVTNGIINSETFFAQDYLRNVTRAEMCNLIAAAYPEEYFAPVNDITAVPDMDKNDYYADIILMLYRAGIILGSDSDGNFNATSHINRSEVAAIINRTAVGSNRLKGEITAGWASEHHIHDIEFENGFELDNLYIPAASSTGEVVDGHLVLIPVERKTSPIYDPQIGNLNTSIRADEFPVLKVRMKMDLQGEEPNMKGEFYFKPEGTASFNENNLFRLYFDKNYYVDAAGWRVYTFFLGVNETWKGNITAFRFDPTNNDGTYIVDYIRFVRNEGTMLVSDEELENNYVSSRMLEDEAFDCGFDVYEPDGDRNAVGTWTYGDESLAGPLWNLLPWWTETCLINDTDASAGEYTLADNEGNKSVKYNPDEKSVTMRLDTEKILNGEPYVSGEMWPHLLLEQSLYNDTYEYIPDAKKEALDLGADKVYLEMDVKLCDFADLDDANKETADRSHVKFNVYLYVAHKQVPGLHTYFGVNPLDSRGNTSTKYDWFRDSESVMMIYRVPASDFVTEENALANDDGTYNFDEWKRIRVDITPHLENVAWLMTGDNTLNRRVLREDLWMSGANVGFEIWGNYQCEVEIKNFNVIGYNKTEN